MDSLPVNCVCGVLILASRYAIYNLSLYNLSTWITSPCHPIGVIHIRYLASLWPLHEDSVSAEVVSSFAKLCVSSLVMTSGSDLVNSDRHTLLHSAFQVMAVWDEVLESALCLLKNTLIGIYVNAKPPILVGILHPEVLVIVVMTTYQTTFKLCLLF